MTACWTGSEATQLHICTVWCPALLTTDSPGRCRCKGQNTATMAAADHDNAALMSLIHLTCDGSSTFWAS